MSLAQKTTFRGIYSKNTKNGIAFIARYTVHGKTKTKIIGYEKDGMTEYEAYKTRLNIIASEELICATIKTKQKHFLVESLFLEFINFRSPLLAKNTRDNYRSIYSQYIVKDFKNQDIRNISQNDLQAYINRVLTYRRPATVEKIISALRKFYLYLQNNGIYKYNPAANLVMPKYDNKKYFSMPKQDVKRFIEYVNDISNLTYKTIYLLLLHGRRINEVLTLKWVDIDLCTGTYHLDHTKTKTRKNQHYHFEEFQLRALKELREYNPKSLYVFENPDTKKPITYTTFHKIHKKLRKDLQMDDFVIHNIRHLVAFMVVNTGYSLEITAKILGHANIQSTQRYAVLEMDRARKAYSDTMKNIMR